MIVLLIVLVVRVLLLGAGVAAALWHRSRAGRPREWLDPQYDRAAHGPPGQAAAGRRPGRRE